MNTPKKLKTILLYLLAFEASENYTSKRRMWAENFVELW